MKEHQATDQQLVRRMLSGEERAFEEFWSAYFPGLYRFAIVRVGQNGDAAEEVVQKALSLAISKLRTYRGEAALFTWLCTFCRHEISSYLRRENRAILTQFVPDTPEIQAALESLLIAVEDRPDQAALRKEVIQTVQTALNALPAHYADVLEWKYIEGLQVKEIAARLNLGLKACESLLTRAREAFRDAFTSLVPEVRWQS